MELSAGDRRTERTTAALRRPLSCDCPLLTGTPPTKSVFTASSLQPKEILRPYVFNPDRPPTRLLFPRFQGGGEARLTDFRKMVNRISIPAGWEAGVITSKMFRHTYCSARLATLDDGAPVSPDTVRAGDGP